VRGLMSRVTVCIPTYARPRWLAGAIESVLAQSYEDFLLEIHDDATPGPAIREIVARYDDPRLRFVEHAANAGIVGNFSRSLLGSRTEYVLQLGDDDEMHPDLLALTVEALDRFPSAGVAHTGLDLIDEDGEVTHAGCDWTGDGGKPPLESGQEFLRASMVYGCRICSSTALIRRSAVPTGAFLQEDFPPFDFACWLRMAVSWDFAFVPRALCRYRMHRHSHSAGLSKLTSDGYAQDLEMLDAVHAVKLRHIAATGGSRELIRLARRGRARSVLLDIRRDTVPARRLGPTLRGLAHGVRVEPALALHPHAWMLLAGSIVGPRAVARLRG
jgi:glycosyltransferase involved in cell wall biosynthesis